jgi:hypothetical protein
MALRFFVVPVRDSGAFEQELNVFLARHKVVSVQRQLIDQGVDSFWAICVDYLIHSPGETTANANLSRSRVDYKAILPLGDLRVYASRCTDLRFFTLVCNVEWQAARLKRSESLTIRQERRRSVLSAKMDSKRVSLCGASVSDPGDRRAHGTGRRCQARGAP